MSQRLVFKPLAYEDLAEAHKWYESKQDGLGTAMASAVLAKVRDIGKRPESYPIILEPSVHRALVERFPYAVFYRIRDKRVVILAILHTSRDREVALRNRIS